MGYMDEFDNALRMMRHLTPHGVLTMKLADGTHHAVQQEVSNQTKQGMDTLGRVTTVTGATFINFILPDVSITKGEGPDMSEARHLPPRKNERPAMRRQS